uniref:ribosomal protein S3 n=1 Tax=Chlorococcum tatrense TaxID=915274 RepID=UPI0010C4EAF1|nr:ribosomal protein S3 [Chlorococcum tatrense]AYQ94304.1 ribosomal protein S3 [Chlorococcum tatrense]
MGQKVHPLGFRVGITKKHQSQWFARFNKNKYAQSVLEDRMLRQTLTNLFPQLLNPVGQSGKKQIRDKNEELSVVPKITQIKIERGLIPYEIGIQIHAENCDLIKKSIENLKVNRDLLCHLQKTRRYLQHLRLKLNDLNTADNSFVSTLPSLLNSARSEEQEKLQSNLSLDTKKEGSKFGGKGSRTVTRSFEKRGFFQRPRLTKQQLGRQRLILKRLKKRQSIRRRYKQLIYKGLFLTKKGNKVIQKFKTSNSSSDSRVGNNSSSFSRKVATQGIKNPSFSNPAYKKKQDSFVLKSASAGISSFSSPTGKGSANSSVKIKKQQPGLGILSASQKSSNILKSRVKRKFVSIFINRMNNKFLQVLKNTFISSLQNLNNKESALGLVYSKKWDFNIVQSQLVLKPLSQLNKLSTVLEQKSLKKMESLRKDYIASGLISKTEALTYYQMLNFLKKLKELISQIKRKQKLRGISGTFSKVGILHKSSSSFRAQREERGGAFAEQTQEGKTVKKTTSSLVQKLQSKTNLTSVTLNVLSTKLNNIENECSKIKFIEYLKQIVKKHRTDNIYLYLSTIADARKDLRKLQQFTKRNASFLFGGTFNTSNISNNETKSNANQLTFERVSNVLKQSSVYSFGNQTVEKTLSEVFLEQIEKQRNMYKDNAQLTPKIAIKFYSVNSDALKAKASVVADSVVDALEKRKAFRKVIKDAKEDLMRTSGVKGVKIQVAGRLNGAEIARSEWVRAGRVPLQTLRANIDYSYKTANTIYGIIGIKVWIFKGYTKLI